MLGYIQGMTPWRPSC